MSQEMDSEITVELTADRVGKAYAGSFKVQIPTIGDRLKISKARIALGGDSLDSEGQVVAGALAHLRYAVVSGPSWWVESNYGHNLRSFKPLMALFEEVMAFEAKFLESTDPGRNSESVSGGDGSDRDAESGVEPDVQPAGQRPPVVIAHTKRGRRSGATAEGAGDTADGAAAI